MPPPNPGQYIPGPGQISRDHAGSYDEWRERVVNDLIRRYTAGLGGIGSDDPELGRPSPEDAGSNKDGKGGFYSQATVQYWERFVDKYGATDVFVQENYGPPPTRRATYVDDPEGQAAGNAWATGENEKTREFEAEQARLEREARAAEAAAERASRDANIRLQEEGENRRQTERLAADQAENERNRLFTSGESEKDRIFRESQAGLDRSLAREREGYETDRVRMQITSNEKLSAQDDLTRRYLAEGDWGVQKWVEEERNRGALERLTMELGIREQELAQDATTERNRHHESMVGLVLEVAKYDSEMAGQPVNWLKYAAWLKNRGQVVNGMTLAMASSNVPESSISASEVAASGLPGSNVAAIQSAQPSPEGPEAAPQQGQTVDPTANPGQQAAMANSAAPAPQPVPMNYKGIDLQNENYPDLLNQILGLNPNAAVDGVDNSPANIQATLDMLNTTGHSENGAQTGSSAPGGVNVSGIGSFNFDARGNQQDYRKFKKLLPGQQQMNVGAAQAGGSAIDDYLYEMNKSRPKGGAVGAGSYG